MANELPQPFDPKYFPGSATEPIEKKPPNIDNKIVVSEKKYGISKPRKIVVRARIVND